MPRGLGGVLSFGTEKRSGLLRAWMSLVLAAALVCWPRVGTAEDSVRPEYRLKANFLALAPSFVEWPTTVADPAKGTFLLCVYGDFQFGTVLADMTRSTVVGGRRTEVRWIKREAELRACGLIFVSRSEQKNYGKLLEDVQGTAALTVGETRDFADAGGIVGLEMSGESLRFDVNLGAADRAHLKLSSRLLALARRVISGAEAARG